MLPDSIKALFSYKLINFNSSSDKVVSGNMAEEQHYLEVREDEILEQTNLMSVEPDSINMRDP